VVVYDVPTAASEKSHISESQTLLQSRHRLHVLILFTSQRLLQTSASATARCCTRVGQRG